MDPPTPDGGQPAEQQPRKGRSSFFLSEDLTASQGRASIPAASNEIGRATFSYDPTEQQEIKDSWSVLMRWSKHFKLRMKAEEGPPKLVSKVVVFGGGSFGTAMGVSLAKKKPGLQVMLLLRDPSLCRDINLIHRNTKYLKASTGAGWIWP